VAKENLTHNFSENLREVESAKHASKLEVLSFSEILREKKVRNAPMVYLFMSQLSLILNVFNIHCVSKKNIPDIFDCNLKTNYQTLIIFSKNIPDTTCHQ